MGALNVLLNYPFEGRKAIQKMMDATAHRVTTGPPAWLDAAPGVLVSGSLWKRNDIKPAGFSEVLVWDGVISNSQELKNELLKAGVVFESRSEEEVLLHWLRIKGEEGVGKLEGMFALAFIDRTGEKIILARDSQGQKPLYYFQKKHQWLFSSEARGIVASGLVEKRLDVNQYLPYFYSRHSFPDQSFFQGVKQVLPGEVRVISFSGHQLLKKRLASKPIPGGLPGLAQFREIILDAVLKNFTSASNVGLVLSGGVDSSLLLHTWFQETGQPLPTFTVAFGSSYSNRNLDSRFAFALAEKYRCAHHEIVITPEVVLQHWEEYLAALDQPIGDSAGFMTWMVAKEAKPYVRKLVTGAGADELFGGYDRHRAFRVYLKYKETLQWLSGKQWLFPLYPRRLKKFIRGVARSDDETFLNFASLETIPSQHRRDFLQYFPRFSSSYKAALTFDLEYYLVNDILKINDSAAMAHGLEALAPYLDSPLVNLSRNMTEGQHRSLRPKQWLKAILEEEGLGEIAGRRKLGFGLPLKEWLKEDSALSRRVFGSIKQLDLQLDVEFSGFPGKLIRNPSAHVDEGFLQIWNLFVLASWKEHQGL